MKVRIALLFERITAHFWIIPALITVCLVSMLFFLKQMSFEMSGTLSNFFFLDADKQAVRHLLSSIATSVMTVLGVVFSVIVLVIENMSNQYTPRVVSNFTRSKIAQMVLGFYVGTFAYCLILLMNIDEKINELPSLAVIFAGILAMLCLFLLIVYIHHVTQSLQSTQIIKNISVESVRSLRNIIKDRDCSSHDGEFIRTRGFQFARILYSTKVGYIDFIDWKKFEHNLRIFDWEIQFHKSAGDFVHKESEILTLWTDEEVSEETVKKLMKFIDVTSNRTISQDPGYGIQKLCDIALKALSPGINDASTAVEAVYSLTSVILEYVKSFPLQNTVQIDSRRIIVFVPCQEKDVVIVPFERILTFAKEHEHVVNIIIHQMRFVHQRLQDRDLRKFLSQKIDSIQSFQEPYQH